MELGTGFVFKYGKKTFVCVERRKTKERIIEEYDPYDQQKWIRFENTYPKPPLKAGDVLLFGEDNWFCCHGSKRIVSTLKYSRIYEQSKSQKKGFQFLIA